MFKKVPQQERSRALVDSVLEAATRILSTCPACEFTTKRVAEVAGVGIGSLYQYFADKESIVQSLLDRHVDETMALVNDVLVVCEGQRAADCYRTIVREGLALHERARNLHLRLQALMPSSPLLIDTKPRQVHIKRMSEALQVEFPGLSPASSLLHARILLDAARTLVHWALELNDPNRDQITVEHYDAFIGSYVMALSEGAPWRHHSSRGLMTPPAVRMSITRHSST